MRNYFKAQKEYDNRVPNDYWDNWDDDDDDDNDEYNEEEQDAE